MERRQRHRLLDLDRLCWRLARESLTAAFRAQKKSVAGQNTPSAQFKLLAANNFLW
jgi:hypothetical protein